VSVQQTKETVKGEREREKKTSKQRKTESIKMIVHIE